MAKLTNQKPEKEKIKQPKKKPVNTKSGTTPPGNPKTPPGGH